MKITKAQLKEIIKEELSEADWSSPSPGLDPRGEEAAEEYRHLAEQIGDMIRAKAEDMFGKSARMERGSVMYILDQAMKHYERLE
jgi:hypothetical protein